MYEYLCFLSILSILILVFAYIKIRYPFWNIQPVYHTYDYWRWFYKTPFLIQRSAPRGSSKTKFYSKNVKTIAYSDATDEDKTKLVDLVQCYWSLSDRILITMDSEYIHNILTGHNHPSYISFYNDVVFGLIPKSDDDPDSLLTRQDYPIGCMVSYPTRIFMWNQEGNSIETPAYTWDLLCIHREHREKLFDRQIIQTHEFNQRLMNSEISVSFFKREEKLCEGIVPLVEFKTCMFYLRNVRIPPLLPNFLVTRIHEQNLGILSDFLYGISHTTSPMFRLCAFPEMGSLVAKIKAQQLYVYALKHKDDIHGVYFFKNSKVVYEELENGNLLECSATVSNTRHDGVFFAGFLHALRGVLDNAKNSEKFEYKLITFATLGHNGKILEKWRWKYTPIVELKAAYYIYNMVVPGTPFSQDSVMVL